ncbi:Ran-binding protein 10 [Zalerion maritima]|uniref:Ran-binding protein 10 n=1 Tax=Zalerion maritima TaxID=339359 RepID=A0AAD5RQ60_9PEZI|nr:Ran-binding protein 10 [Zalerion maritima]
MSSPFQHAFQDQDANFYAGITGHSRTRRPSYISAHPATRANAFSNLLNPTLQVYTGPSDSHHRHHSPSASASAPSSAPYRNQEPEPEQNGTTADSGPRRPWATRSTHLPPSSRAFNLFLGGGAPVAPNNQLSSAFFIPSYLRGTVFAEKLQDQYKATIELKDSHSMGTQSTSGGGSSGSSNGTNGAVQNGKKSGSHRGVPFQVVERNSHPLEDRTVGELPTKWNRHDRATHLEVSLDGLEAKFVAPRTNNEREHEAAAIRADNPVPPACGIYYFEVTVLSKKREETFVCVGFASRKVSINRAPGWETESWGYHGDDGNTFVAQNSGRDYGPRFTTGDTVGCGVNFRTNSIFFTKNGVDLGCAFHDKRESLAEIYPIVGMKKTGENIRANFGQFPFIFNIDGMMQSCKDEIWQDIRSTSADNLVPGLDETELIQSLVLQYLQHDGYVETARAFAQETHAEKQDLNLDPNAQIPGPSIRDDEDATNRQEIRCAVLEGDIDKALELTTTHYPNVLKENEHVYFRLKCRKFIEMARRSAEINMRGEHAAKRGGAQFGQQMELDDEEAIDDDDELDFEQDSIGSRSNKIDMTADPEVLLREMIDYGQALKMEFADETRKEYKKALEEAFALIAYPNPLKVKEMAHLMDRKGRVAVAEELNSAILVSLGKSKKASLEKMWAQTEVLLESLRPSGEEGAFVALGDVVDRVPKNSNF